MTKFERPEVNLRNIAFLEVLRVWIQVVPESESGKPVEVICEHCSEA